MGVKKKTRINLIPHYAGRDYSLKACGPFAQQIIAGEGISIDLLSIIAVDDEYLRSLHSRFLSDNHYTDVMTFFLPEKGHKEAEIYVSVDRATINARQYGVTLSEEIARLIAHGLLHLKGYEDKTEAGWERMHQKENELLRKFWST